MSGRAVALALSFLAIPAFYQSQSPGATISTPLQTQSIPMTQTNWGPGSGGVAGPLSFQQFNPALGTLTAVDITMNTEIRNDFILTFVSTPITTTIYAATTQTTDPSVLADPNLVKQLKDGPTVTLFAPNGVTPIFGSPGASLPVDVVSLTETSGTWSSLLPITDPHFIPPDDAKLSLSQTLNATNDAPLLAAFIGTGTVGLPVTATAHSSVFSSSFNGGGAVLTSADATVTVQYFYTPFAPPPVPEPSGLILLGLGAGLGLLAAGRPRRARAARPAEGDRA